LYDEKADFISKLTLHLLTDEGVAFAAIDNVCLYA